MARGRIAEIPDLTVDLDRLAPRVLERPVGRVEIRTPFVHRIADPPIRSVAGVRATALRGRCERLVRGLDGNGAS